MILHKWNGRIPTNPDLDAVNARRDGDDASWGSAIAAGAFLVILIAALALAPVVMP